MSETGRGGINRPLSWIKKVLEITEKTVVPDSQLPDVRAVIDVFGWERFAETESDSRSTANLNVIVGPVVPDGFIRYVLAASVETNAASAAETLWIDWAVETGEVVGLAQPFEAIPRDIAGGEIRLGLQRPIVMKAGDTLRGRCNPAMALGERIFLNQTFVDIRVGEYLPAV